MTGRIGAGKDFAAEIDSNLESAQIILLLVSANFIASDYCYDIEMKRAMERNSNGEARVIPVILHPCDWEHAPFGNLLAMPPDGKPISKFPNQHDAFLAITKEIRKAAGEISGSQLEHGVAATRPAKSAQITSKLKPRSSNLRVRREFSDIEKSRFLSETFEYIANFFENSLDELKARSTGIECEFKRVDANSFTSAIYRNGKLITQCKIWLAEDDYSNRSIRFSSARSFFNGSFNESVSVEDDGYTLGLKFMGLNYRLGQDDSLKTQEGSAEGFWGMLIEYLQ